MGNVYKEFWLQMGGNFLKKFGATCRTHYTASGWGRAYAGAAYGVWAPMRPHGVRGPHWGAGGARGGGEATSIARPQWWRAHKGTCWRRAAVANGPQRLRGCGGAHWWKGRGGKWAVMEQWWSWADRCNGAGD